jgi:hypothetical protein
MRYGKVKITVEELEQQGAVHAVVADEYDRLVVMAREH